MKIITNEAFIEGQGSTSIADANTPKVAMAVQSPAMNVQLAAMAVQSPAVNVQLARSHP
jgi:hypothetical protein